MTRVFVVDGREIPDPRNTAAWQRLRACVVLEEPLCWLRLEGCTLRSTTGDHIIPVVDRPDLALVRSNVRGACSSCNYRRGNLPISALNLDHDPTTPRPRPAALSIFDGPTEGEVTGS